MCMLEVENAPVMFARAILKRIQKYQILKKQSVYRN